VTWAESVEDAIEKSAVAETLQAVTAADRETLSELEGRFGSSRTTREFSAHLDRRLQTLDNPDPPTVEGVTDATSALFWEHREELSEVDLAAYSELHGILRGRNNVNVRIDGEGE